MRKGIKILGKVVSVVILSLLMLPVFLSLLLDIPAVQNGVVKEVAELITNKLGVRIGIQRIDVGLFNRVRIDGFLVEDFERDTMIFAERLDVAIDPVTLLGDAVDLRRVRLEGGCFNLRETPRKNMNVKEVVDTFLDPNRPEGKGNFKLVLHRIEVERFDLRIERLEHRNPVYGIDYGNIQILGIDAALDHFTVDGPMVHATIRRLSAIEQSGFRLEDFSGRFVVSGGCIGVQEGRILTERSDVRIPELGIVGNGWTIYKDFIPEVDLAVRFEDSSLSTDDLGYFAPGLRTWGLQLSDVNGSMEGTVDDFTGRLDRVQIESATELIADFAVRGLPDYRKSHFTVDIERLTTAAVDVDRIVQGVTHKPLSEGLLRIVQAAGKVGVTGQFDGQLSDFSVDALLSTSAGTVDCDLAVTPAGEQERGVRGRVAGGRIDLGRLLASSKLGDLSLTASIDGTLGRGSADAAVTGEITCLEFNDYAYDSLRLDGRILNRQFDGRIGSRNQHLDFDFSGLCDLNDEVPRYDFALDLHHADLHALHFNRRDSLSHLSARLEAQGTGRSLDDLNGRLIVRDAAYLYPRGEIRTDSLFIEGKNSPSDKYIGLQSNFADLTFRSPTSYTELFAYLRHRIRDYVPMLGKESELTCDEARALALEDGISRLNLTFHRIEPLCDALSQGLQVADGTTLDVAFNPVGDSLTLTARSAFVERGNMLLTRLQLEAGNRGDSIVWEASTDESYIGALHLSRLALMGGAKGQRMAVAAEFADSTARTSGRLGFRSRFADQSGPAGRRLDIRLLPSHLTLDDQTWNLYLDRLEADTSRIRIDRFRVAQAGQELLLDGTLSRSRDDSVTLRLRNFDLEPLMQIAAQRGYVVEGVSNGSATMRSALSGAQLTAQIRLDSVRVNDLPAPATELRSRWDFERNRAGILLMTRDTRDTVVRGFYAPSSNRYYARARLDRLNMQLLDPIMTGVLSGTQGTADALLEIEGRGRQAQLSGEIAVSDLHSTVDFTQVTYSVPAATLRVENNHFLADQVTVYDPEQNEGALSLDIDLSHLSNVSYAVHITPRRMLVLDTSQEDSDLFYGHVYASGLATVTGSKGAVRMDVTAETEGPSAFYMPLSSKSNVKNTDFVTFRSPIPSADTTDYLVRKKMIFERRHRKKSSAGSAMDIRMELNVRDNTNLQLMIDPAAGNIIKGRGEGVLNLHIQPSEDIFEMYGDYTITEGSYLFALPPVLSKRFKIENGSMIQWTGEPLDARLDIDATYDLKASLRPLLASWGSEGNERALDRMVAVDCKIHIGDQLTQPSVTFDVEVPESDVETRAAIDNVLSNTNMAQQFLYLLLFNAFYPESFSSSTTTGASMTAAAGLEVLASQLSNWLSTEDYRIKLGYRAATEITSDELDFGFSRNLIDDRLSIEVEGNYIIDNREMVRNNASNFMGEAHITWKIDRAGNLRLEAFTQTIDRFDENQGLQETGLGIYYKEDFNNLRDLKQRIINRFVDRNRQQQRRERRAEKRAAKRGAAAGVTTEAAADTTLAGADSLKYSEQLMEN